MSLLRSLCLVLMAAAATHTARVSDKIYESIEGNMACFKRFNGTHEVGCTSDYKGNVGVLYLPSNVTDLTWALEHGPHPPYIFALRPDLFTRAVLMQAKESKNVKGIVILGSEENLKMIDEMSPASSCPSHAYGLYNYSSNSIYKDNCAADPWNTAANSLLFESFDFPIFFIKNENSIKAITKCFYTYNIDASNNSLDWPLCSLQLRSNMFGTTNTEVCLRRTQSSMLTTTNYCDPIFDYNIMASLNPMLNELEDSSVIVVAARADAATLFDNVSPGADSAVTGVVTLLAVAEALNAYKNDIDAANKHVVFILFEGETWDYLGSASVGYDMSLGQFPYPIVDTDTEQIKLFNFSHIDYFIELSQLGIQEDNENTELFYHSDPISDSDSDIALKNSNLQSTFNEAARNNNVKLDVTFTNGKPLPPASFQTFLKYYNISGTVLTDHGSYYTNKYYQGVLDNEQNVNFSGTINSTNSNDHLHKHLQRIASTVASAVYFMATKNQSVVDANADLIGDLLVCYLKNVNCSLFREHSGSYLLHSSSKSYFQEQPAKMYTSVNFGEEMLTDITLFILSDFIGTVSDDSKQDCWSNKTSPIQKYFMATNGVNGTCFVSTARKLGATSPAFRIPGYNYSSGEYPTWTESGWSSTSVRLFLKPSPSEEIGLVIGGVLFVLVSCLLSYWAEKKANVLFVATPGPVPC